MSDARVPLDEHELAALAEGSGDDELLARLEVTPDGADLLRAARDEVEARERLAAGVASDAGSASGDEIDEQDRARRAALLAGARSLVVAGAGAQVDDVAASAGHARAHDAPATGGQNASAGQRVTSLAEQRGVSPALQGLLGMAAALLLGLTVVMGPGAGSTGAGWPPEALPVRVTRDVAAEGSVRSVEIAGLAAYADGDFERSRVLLVEALARGGRPDLAIYAASAALLSGDTDLGTLWPDAERLAALSDASSGRLAGEALWQLVQVQWALGNRRAARAVAERLLTEAPEGARADQARDWLADLR